MTERARKAATGSPPARTGVSIALADIKLILAELLTVCRPEIGAGQAYETGFQFGVTVPEGLAARFSSP